MHSEPFGQYHMAMIAGPASEPLRQLARPRALPPDPNQLPRRKRRAAARALAKLAK